ncbi:SDR family NAD(P)-dependent oxidoreductase [Desulfotalea psychrophila]|uniref:Related to 3-oxoacyl-[acyl-carrier protein] reductase n=1 Tax=Desulfotalea psychrophila (strain LSv54 / DSM 12343) TaxID=177439 RepID=Q6AKA2_DESPS|nr:SDR family oxidoreductase [Desulfotalea psychrophila]CAG37224.1 related to 3-oxoacyl-[acyl-carrier protein] reductase [Desulfotalea psychrophila LSv54]
MKKKRLALIPGASRPIGRAIARAFADAGFELLLPIYDWPDSIAEMNREFRASGYSFTTAEVDLRVEEEVESYLGIIKRQRGRLDVLVNNIERGGMPIIHGSYSHPHNRDQWQREIETTLNAKWFLYQHSLPLLQRGYDASIINISSIAANIGRTGPAALLFSDGYSAANGAISSLTTTWAREAAPHIRVNEIQLGMIDGRHGKGTRGWAEMSKKDRKRLRKHILLRRTGRADEVAKTVLFLACDASYITGASLRIDGGYTLGGENVPPLPPGIL